MRGLEGMREREAIRETERSGGRGVIGGACRVVVRRCYMRGNG